MRLSELCIRRPVMTTLLMASLLLAGFFGYRQLPIAAIPRIDVPTITVSVQYPGASPDTMAVSVAAPLERQFSTIAGVTSITSLNTEGRTQVTLEFELNRNIDAAALDTQSAISVAASRLPEDLPTPPAYRKVNPADTPVIFLALTSETALSQEMNEFADKVMSPRLSMLPGVAQVNIQGAQKQAVRIKYDLDALATRGISVEDIRLAVAAQANISPIGSVRTQHQIYILDVKGAEPTAAYFKPLIVAWRNGAPVRLQDIAKVEDSVEIEEARAEFNAMRSIIVSVQRQPDANTVAVTDAVRKILPQFESEMPPTIKLSVLSDRSESIRDSVHDVQITLTADGGAGHSGHPRLSAQLARDIHSSPCPAAVDHRHLRRHGRVRFLTRQRQPACPDAGARLCRRRRHRRAGKHRALRRAGHEAVRCGHQGRQ